MSNEDDDYNDDEDIDYDNKEIDDKNIILEACIDNIKDEKDLLIGFDPDVVLKNREELKINLIYFDEKITKSNDSYDYYKKFKVNVVGGFYASDEIDIFKKYLEEIKKLNNVPPYVVVTYPNKFEEIYNICLNYDFIKEIIMLSRYKQKYEDYLKTHKRLLKYIAKDYGTLIDYLKKMGDLTTNWNKFLKIFNSKRIFTSDSIQMNRQLNTCPIITAYEYDELYFIVHRAYSHFFKNESTHKDPKQEELPSFDDNCFSKIKEFLKDLDINEDEKRTLLDKFEKLKNSDNFIEDAIRNYTGEGIFCYLLNRVMRNFEKGLIKLAYYLGPLLFGLNKYALEHPEKCLNKDTILYRKLEVSPLDKYIYKFSKEHIICFPSLTSTSTSKKNEFFPTPLSKKTNEDPKRLKEEVNEVDDNKNEILMVIEYKHEIDNITPALDITHLSKSKYEEERLIFPFTFFRINKIENNPHKKNSYIFYMEIINRKTIIEYDLKEGIKYNIESLEELYEENKTIFIEEGMEETLHVREKEKSNCIII